MPRNVDQVSMLLVRTYFTRTSATAQVLWERLGCDPAMTNFRHWQAVGGRNLAKAYLRDREIAEWYCEENTPISPRAQAARRILLLAHFKHMSRTDPFQIPRLIQFDSHYLFVTEVVAMLIEVIPHGIDPFLDPDSWYTYIYEEVTDEGYGPPAEKVKMAAKEKRKVFADQMRQIWWRPRTVNVKIPSIWEFFRLFYNIQKYMKGTGRCFPWKPDREGHEEYKHPELVALVKNAHVEWFATPEEFAEAYDNNGKLGVDIPPPEVDDEPLERLVWALEDIGALVQTGRIADAAVEVLAYSLSSTPGTVITKLREATRTVAGVQFEDCKNNPVPPLRDHRRWEKMDELCKMFDDSMRKEGWNVFRDLAETNMAKRLKVSRDEVEALFGPCPPV